MAELKPIEGTTNVYLWHYLPTIPPAAVFLALFFIAIIPLSWRLIKSGSWFCIPFFVGALSQILGYGLRFYCHFHTESIAGYTVHNCFIGLAPVFYAASIYMVLGRLIRKVHGEQYSLLRPAWITRTFVIADCLALTLQASGIAMTPFESTQKIGGAIVVAGLFVQLAMFGSFVVLAAVFHRRFDRVSSTISDVEIPWRQGLKMLYGCSALILIRSLFRVVEYLMGTDGYLLSHEWPVFVFDAPLMLIAQIIFVWWFPDAFGAGREDHIQRKSLDSTSDLEK